VDWIAIVPVKGTRQAKSRLEPLPARAELAIAFALDTVAALAAARRVSGVIVVTASRELSAELAQPGVTVVIEGDRRRDPTAIPVDAPRDGLNDAIRLGLDEARRRSPGAGRVVVTGDLPSLTPADVDAALRLADEHPRSLIPDADGSGTTALLALAGHELTPRFGAGSRHAHEAHGHVVLDLGPESRIRRDVDDVADLDRALALGVGARTRALIARTAMPPSGTR